jgi:hypothetical protein
MDGARADRYRVRDGTRLPVTTAPRALLLRLVEGRFAVCRLEPGEPLPPWATAGDFWSVTRTPQELSIVCADDQAPPGVRAERGFRALVVDGTLDFSWVGILASLAGALAADGVPLLALSTHDTDVLLVREEHIELARRALVAAGHEVL